MSCLIGIVPNRGLAFIKHIETAETYANSPILIPDQVRDKIAKQQFIVVSVGDYDFCEDPDECNRPHFRGCMHAHHLMEGDWVVVRNRSWELTPDPDVFIIRTEHILGVFRET